MEQRVKHGERQVHVRGHTFFYSCTPLDRYEYMKLPLFVFPEHIKRKYNLETKAKNGFVYVKIRRSIYGLPQAGVLANTFLKELLRINYFIYFIS